MKSFAPKPWVVPQPVLIIGTYNKDGVANAMNAAWAGQWDMKEIMISMGNHVTTDNLKNGGEFTVAFATKKTMWVLISWVLFLPRTIQKRWRKQDGTSRRQLWLTLPYLQIFL